MTKILVADNNEIFLGIIQRMLREEGHAVVSASNPVDALQTFETHRLDAAIIDYRLFDDKEGDRSGLDVAMKSDPRVPKIIISDKTERTEIMDAVQTGPEGFAVATAFLAKNEIGVGKTALHEAIQKALKTRAIWTRQAREAITPELRHDFKQASRFASWQVLLHLVSNIAFVVIMVWAAFNLHDGENPLTMLFLMVGLVAAEVTNLMLATRGREVSLIARADRNHIELLQSAQFEQLLAACDLLGTPAEIKKARLEIIRTATSSWLGSPADRMEQDPEILSTRRVISGE